MPSAVQTRSARAAAIAGVVLVPFAALVNVVYGGQKFSRPPEFHAP